MSPQNHLELFERAVEAGGRLLRAEGVPVGQALEQLVLTFDVGRIVVRADVDGLSARHAMERDVLPGDLVSLGEEEPFWRLIGQPITAAWPGGTESAAGATGSGSTGTWKLRFRAPEENPRVIVIESKGGSMRVSLES